MRLTGDFKKNFEEKFGKTFSQYCFHYFDIVRLLLDKKISAKVPPSFFLEFCGRMDIEKYQNVPLSVFFGIVRLFFNFVFQQRAPLQFFDDLRQK